MLAYDTVTIMDKRREGHLDEIRGYLKREWDTLLEVRAQQAVLLKALERVTNDHEKRIRFLERIIGYGIGAIGVVKFLVDVYLAKQ